VIDHLTYFFYLYFFLFSSIGYGLKFSNIISNNLVNLNFGWYGIIGFFLISTFSIITSFFFAHNYYHNLIIHIIGVFLFCISYLENKKKIEYKYLIILSLCLLIGAYVFKNHDDFPYYHLTYALNLSENSFIVGTGNFSHGFRTFSSLFYYHSTLYLPFIEYYLFHIGPFYILVFFNYIIIFKLINETRSNQNNLINYFALLSLIFINIVFYRIGEHGTDRSSQILLILIFLVFIQILNLNNNKKLILTYLSLLAILITFAASMKAIYYLYFLLLPLIFFKKKLFDKFLKKKNIIIISLVFLSIFLNLITNYLNTGCLLYPAEKTCLIKQEWSIPSKEVKHMSTHYEWWAKAGGGPGYSHELKKDEYIKNFIWLNNWIERHFFNKVSDTLLGTILMCIIVILTFFYFKRGKLKTTQNKNILTYFLILIFFIEWFLNHPAMRYGGFVLIGLPFILFSSSLISRFLISKKNLKNLIIFFIILSIVVFNLRNFIRINKEIKVYGYDPIQSPFFYIDKVDSKIATRDDDLKIYNPKDKMCWASKTPCSYSTNLKLGHFLWMRMVSRK